VLQRLSGSRMVLPLTICLFRMYLSLVANRRWVRILSLILEKLASLNHSLFMIVGLFAVPRFFWGPARKHCIFYLKTCLHPSIVVVF